MMNSIEEINHPVNSVVGNQLDNLKEVIAAQPHIETMTEYTNAMVDATIDTANDVYTLTQDFA